MLADRLPPQNIEAEESVLGAMLVAEPKVIGLEPAERL